MGDVRKRNYLENWSIYQLYGIWVVTGIMKKKEIGPKNF